MAANFAAVGMGADTGGSLRYPAADTNLSTIRVTEGRTSRHGMLPGDPRKVAGETRSRGTDTAGRPRMQGRPATLAG